jgi:hypothetical protein
MYSARNELFTSGCTVKKIISDTKNKKQSASAGMAQHCLPPPKKKA